MKGHLKIRCSKITKTLFINSLGNTDVKALDHCCENNIVITL